MWRSACALAAALLMAGSSGRQAGSATLDRVCAVRAPSDVAPRAAPTKAVTSVARPSSHVEHPLVDAQRILRAPKYLYLIPPDCGKTGSFDLVLQFHAAEGPTEATFRASELDAVVVIINLGLASGPYENMFLGKRAFGDYLAAVSAEVRSGCRGAAPRRAGWP